MTIEDKNDRGRLDVLIDTMSLIILPPMYFFSFVYYTDVPSLTSILFMVYFSLKERYLISSSFGLFSVFMRQTNIVWVAGILGTHVVNDMMRKVYPKLKLEESKFSHFWFALKTHLKEPKQILHLVIQSIKTYSGYILVVLAFIAFLIINGSIVGNKKLSHYYM